MVRSVSCCGQCQASCRCLVNTAFRVSPVCKCVTLPFLLMWRSGHARMTPPHTSASWRACCRGCGRKPAGCGTSGCDDQRMHPLQVVSLRPSPVGQCVRAGTPHQAAAQSCRAGAGWADLVAATNRHCCCSSPMPGSEEEGIPLPLCWPPLGWCLPLKASFYTAQKAQTTGPARPRQTGSQRSTETTTIIVPLGTPVHIRYVACNVR